MSFVPYYRKVYQTINLYDVKQSFYHNKNIKKKKIENLTRK